MLITTTKENLLIGINSVSKAINPRSIIPIYSCVKLEAKDNSLIFTGTSLDMGIECTIPVSVEEPGIAVVPAKYLGEVIRKLPDTPITLKIDDSSKIKITSGSSELTLNTMNAEDFPKLPSFNSGLDFVIKADSLKKMVKQTSFACSLDEMKAIFTGLLWEIDGSGIVMVGTDTHRLAYSSGSVFNFDSQSSGKFIFPAKTAIEISRLIQDGDCRVKVDKNIIFFEFDNIKINCRMLEGNFPNYRQVIPNEYKTKFKADTKSLLDSVDRISLFASSDDNTNTIHLEIKDNKINLNSKSEIGFGNDSVDIEKTGEDMNISFNAKFLTDVFKVIDTDKVNISLSGSLSAGIIEMPEDKEFLYLVLPVRV